VFEYKTNMQFEALLLLYGRLLLYGYLSYERREIFV